MSLNTTSSSQPSSLLKKMQSKSWAYAFKASLLGVQTTLLVKYIIDEDAYAIMLTDLGTIYFECVSGDQLNLHYNRFNKLQLDHDQILVHIGFLLSDLRATGPIFVDKIDTDCHTQRIILKTSSVFSERKFCWTFYTISAEQEVFIQHFSLPLFRGFFSLMRKSNETDPSTITQKDNQIELEADRNELACLEDDPTLAKMFLTK